MAWEFKVVQNAGGGADKYIMQT